MVVYMLNNISHYMMGAVLLIIYFHFTETTDMDQLLYEWHFCMFAEIMSNGLNDAGQFQQTYVQLMTNETQASIWLDRVLDSATRTVIKVRFVFSQHSHNQKLSWCQGMIYLIMPFCFCYARPWYLSLYRVRISSIPLNGCWTPRA